MALAANGSGEVSGLWKMGFCLGVGVLVGGGEEGFLGRSLSDSEAESESSSEPDVSVVVESGRFPVSWVSLMSLMKSAAMFLVVVTPLVTLWTYLSVMVQVGYAGTDGAVEGM